MRSRFLAALFVALCLLGIHIGNSAGQVVYNNGDCMPWTCAGTYDGCVLNGQGTVETCDGKNNTPCNPLGNCCSLCSGGSGKMACDVNFYFCP